ncbi:hypothetical protein ABTX60_15235 [Streptomyces sp. NPDC126510]|uniref:hypothetical protein n=1 Tax=Streptomyces sp. NPDC126510 TaxID=3155317 RepID=UPI003321F576
MSEYEYFALRPGVFVGTASPFHRLTLQPPAQMSALRHRILAVHRDHLALWNNGASLLSPAEVMGDLPASVRA